LDEYLQATRIAVSASRIDLSMDLTPGVAIVDSLWIRIDTDRDRRVSDAEAAAYARSVLDDLRIGLDGHALRLSLVGVTFPPMSDVREGQGIIRIKAMARVEDLAPGRHALSLTNAHLPAISVYLVNALVPKDPAVKITRQVRDELQKSYRLEFEFEEGADGVEARNTALEFGPRRPAPRHTRTKFTGPLRRISALALNTDAAQRTDPEPSFTGFRTHDTRN
jgi:hypothetical protein